MRVGVPRHRVARGAGRSACALACLTLWSALMSCSHSETTRKGDAPLGTGTVVLEAGGRTLRVLVEVARTPEQRTKGLKYRKDLGAYRGMIFLFDEDEVQSFWMQDTYIALDMVFISRNLEVVGVVENAQPLTTTSRKVGAPSRYVLEVRGGFAKEHGVKAGTRVRFEGIL